MPRPPSNSESIGRVRSSPFSAFASRFTTMKGERYPLHVGDTWMEPWEGARMEVLHSAEQPGMHRYTSPHGHPDLLAALSSRCNLDPSQILVTAGATGGLSAAAAAMLDPGDEVLILSPFWPLIRGIVQTNKGVPVEVPCPVLSESTDRSLSQALEARLSERTVAVYVNNPNNPTGRAYDEPTLLELVEFARRHELWIWSDEVYEEFHYEGDHVATRELAPERTLTAHSFSKTWGMTGNRVGFVTGPAPIMAELHKAGTHMWYCAPTSAQLAAVRVMEGGSGWLAEARASYEQAGRRVAEVLGVPPAQGGTFLFVNVAEHLDERGLSGFLEDCLEHNLLLAPGSSCGQGFDAWLRLCFTAAPPEVVERGAGKLALLLGR
jgi:N-succinyldiaminopimelate aminotransferase